MWSDCSLSYRWFARNTLAVLGILLICFMPVRGRADGVCDSDPNTCPCYSFYHRCVSNADGYTASCANVGSLPASTSYAQLNLRCQPIHAFYPDYSLLDRDGLPYLWVTTYDFYDCATGTYYPCEPESKDFLENVLKVACPHFTVSGGKYSHTKEECDEFVDFVYSYYHPNFFGPPAWLVGTYNGRIERDPTADEVDHRAEC